MTLLHKFKILINGAAFFVFIGILCSCGPEIQDASRDDAINAYLNQRNYDQAIPLIKEALKENPKSDRHRILLASALSGSIGIDTIECFEVLRPKIFDRPIGKTEGASNLNANLISETSAPDITERRTSKMKALLALEKELLKFFRQTTDTLEIAYKLPHVDVAKRDRLVSALSILAEIEPDSEHYQTAQLYVGILGFIQFMNYIRDGIPESNGRGFAELPWHISIFCQIDLAIIMPNLSRAVTYLEVSFDSFRNAGRSSENPLFASLGESRLRLVSINRFYFNNLDLIDFADWTSRATKPEICDI